jgi:Gpi18-like mannosyltransferase
VVLLAGLALRLVFLPVAGSRQDNLDFQRWADSAVAEGFGGLYTRDALILNSPPAYLYPLALDGLIHHALTLQAAQPWPPAALDPAFFMLQKLNPILADLGTAALLFFALRRRIGAGRALAGAAAVALNPALIYTSGYWGQVDGIVLGLLTATFLAIVARHPVLAGVLGGLALAAKPQAALFLPWLGLFLLGVGGWGWGVGDQGSGVGGQGSGASGHRSGGGGWRRALGWGMQALGAGAAVLAVLFAPFWFGGSGARVLEPYTRAVGHFTLVALNAFNGWWMVYGEAAGGVEDSVALVGGWTARQIGLGLLFAALLCILALYGRALRRLRAAGGANRQTYATALALAAVALAFFLLPTQVHERYALYLLPFLLLAALWRPPAARWGLGLVWVVSALVWLNLYYIVPLVPWERPVQQFVGDVLGRGVALALFGVGAACLWALATVKRET